MDSKMDSKELRGYKEDYVVFRAVVGVSSVLSF